MPQKLHRKGLLPGCNNMCCFRFAGVKKDLLQIVQRLHPFMLTFPALLILLTPLNADVEGGELYLFGEKKGV